MLFAILQPMSSTAATVTTTTPRWLEIERGLAFLDDRELLLEMLGLLEQNLGTDIARIWQFLDADDAAAAARVLHPLKGILPIFSSDELVEQVIHTELLCKTLPASEVRPVFAQTAASLGQFLTQMQRFLSESS